MMGLPATAAVSLLPEILIHPTDQHIASGDPLLLSVTVTGNNATRSQWRLDGSILVGQTNETLEINQIAPTQTGFYNVLVSNARGTVSSRNAAVRTFMEPVSARPNQPFHRLRCFR